MSIEDIAIAKGDWVLLPKGDDKEQCIELFQYATGIEVPTPEDRELSTEIASQGLVFIWLKGADIPNAVTEVTNTDTETDEPTRTIWGVTGGDNMIESVIPKNQYRVWASGPVMCKFALACKEKEEDKVRSRLYAGRSYVSPLKAATSFPVLLKSFIGSSDLNIGSVRRLEGSVEIAPKLYGDDIAADIVQEGKTARQNGLTILEELMDVRPMLFSGVRI